MKWDVYISKNTFTAEEFSFPVMQLYSYIYSNVSRKCCSAVSSRLSVISCDTLVNKYTVLIDTNWGVFVQHFSKFTDHTCFYKLRQHSAVYTPSYTVSYHTIYYCS